MPNKKINELSPRTPSLTDLIIVGDPSTGYSYKATISVMAAFVSGNIQFSSLGGVSITSPTSGQYLTFNGTNWVNSTLSTTTWDTAYNRSITAAAVSGTTTKTLTLTKQDGSTLTASWSDLNTDAVTSVFGRTGVVVAAEGDYSLDQLGDVIITTPSTNQVLQYNGTAWVNATFVAGINSLNGLTATTQTFATGTSGTDFAITSTTSTHTFNLPTASAVNRGALSSADWSTFNGKVGGSGTTNYLSKWTSSSALGNSLVFDNGTSVGVNTASPSATYKLDVNGVVNGTSFVSSGKAFKFNDNGTQGQFASDGANTFIDYVGRINYRPGGGGTVMQITAAGRLLIGTTVESTYELDLVGDFRSTLDANINGLTVGKGGGQLATNTAVGFEALNATNTGGNNVAIGYRALKAYTGDSNVAIGTNALTANTTGNTNVGIGTGAGQAITTANKNTLVGYGAGSSNVSSHGNTYIGYYAGVSATANANTLVGSEAGYNMSTAAGNTFVGNSSGRAVTTGGTNTLVGYFSGYALSTGSENVLIGNNIMASATTASQNTIVGAFAGNVLTGSGNAYFGWYAGVSATSSVYNTGVGYGALQNITTGSNNTSLGYRAGRFFGAATSSNTTGANGIFVGYQSRASADGNTNETVIGYDVVGNGSNSVTLGNTSVTKTVLQSGVLVGTTTSAGYALDVNGTARVSGNFTALNNSTVTSYTETYLHTLGSSSTFDANVKFGNYGNNSSFAPLWLKFTGSGRNYTDDIRFTFEANDLSATTLSVLYNNFKKSTGAAISSTKALVRYANNGTDYFSFMGGGDFYVHSGSVGIGTTSPNASALVDIVSTTKGFLPPRMTGTQAEAIASPAAGLMVYANNGNGTTITSTGWWGYNGSGWVKLN